MRLDLFLKSARLVKRRVVAQAMCESGRVLVNGRDAKPAKEIRAGDRVTLRYAARTLEVEVLDVPGLPGRAQAGDLFRVASEELTPKGDEPWKRSPL